MRRRITLLIILICTLTLASYSQAQFPQPNSSTENDPLHRTQTPSTAACTTDTTSSCAEVAAKIFPLILGPSPMQENLRRLTDEIGGRVTGSPAMDRAVQWASSAFRAAGVDVHTEKYQLPLTWSEGDTRLELLGEIKFPLRTVSLGWSPATPPGGIEANVVDIAYGTPQDFTAAAAHLKGAILLVHTDLGSTWADLFNEYFRPPDIIERAIKADAAAILWESARERLLLYRHTNTGDGQLEKIPQAIVAREDALRLSRTVLAYPGKIRARFSMPNKIGPPIDQENVIAEIPGYEKPDESVVLGAHLDSWDLGTGALDNGCNAALVIEAARVLKATGLRPRRTIRFILFSGEEQGLLGSWAYVKTHRAELDKIRAVIIFDSGIGRVTGYSLGGRPDLAAGVREVLKPLNSWDVNRHTTDAQTGTDHFDFLIEGLPTLVANQEEANYLPNYHAASDTLDKVDIRELKLNTTVAALTAWGLADRLTPVGKRLSRAELETLMKESGLDQEMKSMGFWNDWQNGTRGRQH
ncbi:MAG TPA: M20/M25/M40 family metallo-hydrolase [Verrucomicrobiae bacterium]|jgi:carboxypeptidase Q|nr:M20/M25/M40 family metallo-hydrolase [Verrucomicrobiae bacterium]